MTSLHPFLSPHLFHTRPISPPSLFMSSSPSQKRWIKVGKFKNLVNFDGLQICYSVFQRQISLTEIDLSLLLLI